MTKAQLAKHPNIAEWEKKHVICSGQYIYQLKNCGKYPDCPTCPPPKLDPQVFASISHIPEPELCHTNPSGPMKYASFAALYGKAQPRPLQYVPSVQKGSINVDGRI